MTEECLKCEYATYDCQSYGACRKRWFLDKLDRDLVEDEAEREEWIVSKHGIKIGGTV